MCNTSVPLKGFTLIELVVVVAIAALLVVAFLLFGNPAMQSAKAKDSQRRSDITHLKAALDLYYNDHKCYPDSIPTDSWIENGTVYMIKVPKDPDFGTAGYVYQVDQSDTCPQWNILYNKYTSRAYTDDDCALSAMNACDYVGTYACSLSGNIDCNYISSNPAVASESPSPTVAPDSGFVCTTPLDFIKDINGNCNVAPAGEGLYCQAQCP